MSETERNPLEWPKAQPRTRIELQANLGAARKGWHDYMKALDIELKKMGVIRHVVTVNPPGVRDPGVAVWFDRKKDEEFKWQDILGLDSPWPTLADIDKAYRFKAPALHPDRHQDDPGFDPEPFHQLERARREGIAFIKGTTELPKGFVIPCDAYKERNHNLYAILRTIKALRDIERFGAGQLFEGALGGFREQLTAGAAHV